MPLITVWPEREKQIVARHRPATAQREFGEELALLAGRDLPLNAANHHPKRAEDANLEGTVIHVASLAAGRTRGNRRSLPPKSW